MNSAELREKYLAFFEEKGCQRWPSSSLVPDDPSMLLTSAGMVQFKPWFLQQRQLPEQYVGTTTVQKCVRTTDIDVIGDDGRHLSFFEMLGNFSFGAYFKQEMCEWALEFSTDVLGFDVERLYFTVFEDDDETIEIWKGLGIDASHIFRLGEKDNFWRAGPTGPCGPCSELYYDQGADVGCGCDDCAPGCDCDRFLEYWNCVFTQFDGQEDGSLAPLPKNNIDTGMGLERTIAILNGFETIWETDILRGLIAISEQLSGQSYGRAAAEGAPTPDSAPTPGSVSATDRSMRIIADHIRTCTFLIGDGVLPGNEGRGYVLRRLLRRAMRHGHLLGIEAPFLSHSVGFIVQQMAEAYPEIRDNQSLIERVITAEEERFAQTLRQGQSFLEANLDQLTPGQTLDGQAAFELHDRYGFPIDLTVEIAAEQGFDVDIAGFEELMAMQRQRARDAVVDNAWAMTGTTFVDLAMAHGKTQFVGYEVNSTPAQIVAILVDDEAASQQSLIPVETIAAGVTAQIILDQTPFYAEMGGQVGDSGQLLSDGQPAFTVNDTQTFDGVYTHIGVSTAALSVGDSIIAGIDTHRRRLIERNHTGTHLLHYALRQVVGDHVKQAGSLVAPDRLRFDFTHFEPLTAEQLEAVEALANQLVFADRPVSASYTSLDEARAAGVIALFGEKYDDTVRVLTAGEESSELCGGTHVDHTSQIGLIKIVSESSVGSSMRRIEAYTSEAALAYIKAEEQQLKAVAEVLKTRPAEVADRAEALQMRVRELEAQLTARRRSTLAEYSEDLLQSRVEGLPFVYVVRRIDGLNIDEMRGIWDILRNSLQRQPDYSGAAALVLGGITEDGTPMLLAAATTAAVDLGFDAGATIRRIAPIIGGGGGGRPTMAQAGGKDADALDTALDAARTLQ